MTDQHCYFPLSLPYILFISKRFAAATTIVRMTTRFYDFLNQLYCKKVQQLGYAKWWMVLCIYLNTLHHSAHIIIIHTTTPFLKGISL